jgi:hypothetical protein
MVQSATGEVQPAIAGDYLEARSSHVYTCGCLANSELVTAGREAILAWRWQQGELAGAKAVAVVVGEANLGLEKTARRSTLYVEAGSAERQEAVLNQLRTHYRALLGEVLAVHPAPIRFRRDEAGASVEIDGLLQVEMRPAKLPDDAHPGSYLWYRPFIPTVSETLGTTLFYQYTGDDFRRQWTRYEPAIAGFLGSFTLPQ